MKIEESEVTRFSAVETEAIQQLRQNLREGNADIDEDRLMDDEYLLQWLKVNNIDVTKTEKLVLESLKWRKENNLENLGSTVIPGDCYTTYPYYLDGLDKDGRIVVSYSCGTWDLPTLIENGRRDHFYNYVIQMLARVEEKVIQTQKESRARGGKRIYYESVWVVNVADAPMRNFMCRKTLTLISELTCAFDKNFPDIVHRCYFINASNVFIWLFKILKQFISAQTLPKIEVLGTDKRKWKPLVFQNIEPDQLRPIFGGTKQIK